MVQIEQVEGKFVTGYAVFSGRPDEADLVVSALDRHIELFGHKPQVLAADKGYYRSMEELYRRRSKSTSSRSARRVGGAPKRKPASPAPHSSWSGHSVLVSRERSPASSARCDLRAASTRAGSTIRRLWGPPSSVTTCSCWRDAESTPTRGASG